MGFKERVMKRTQKSWRNVDEGGEVERRTWGKIRNEQYIFIHFTKNRNWHTTAHIDIGDTIIKPANEAKYLEVIFNRKLSFTHHIEYPTNRDVHQSIQDRDPTSVEPRFLVLGMVQIWRSVDPDRIHFKLDWHWDPTDYPAFEIM